MTRSIDNRGRVFLARLALICSCVSGGRAVSDAASQDVAATEDLRREPTSKEALALRGALDQWYYFAAAPDTIDLNQLVDLEALWKAVQRHESTGGGNARRDVIGFDGVAERLLQRMAPDAFDEFEIIESYREKPGQISARVRFWNDDDEVYAFNDFVLVADEPKQWRIGDVSDPISGVWLSQLLSAFVNWETGVRAVWVDSFLSVQERVAELDYGVDPDDFDLLMGDIRELLSQELPRVARKVVLKQRIGCLYFDGREKPLFRALNAFEDIDLGDEGAAYYRLLIHYKNDYWDGVLEAVSPVAERYGWNSEFYEYAADAHFFLGQRRKAERHARLGLGLNPSHWGLIMTFAASSKRENWEQIRSDIQATGDPELCYEWVLDYLLSLGKRALARQVTQFLSEDYPDHPLLAYYEDLLGVEEPQATEKQP